eukprot:CAMPEP_0116828492 /NCGR_PEP_ID=MMETSP0418-20121206/3682_1 /TAXON_ID=1158023 /ORGANISM="Astrosyne radiata, Strain 13vi08-1A" /LENGTH=69 /DNA_ID=CAMNT_0004457379 /DNA_START=1003 /DNA_END=1212 /DNA_ORIENTATION=-
MDIYHPARPSTRYPIVLPVRWYSEDEPLRNKRQGGLVASRLLDVTNKEQVVNLCKRYPNVNLVVSTDFQ